MVYTSFTPLLRSTVVYDYSTLRVEGSKKENVNLYIDAIITNAEGESQRTSIPFSVVEEEDGWRLSSVTYQNYNASKDRYDQLKDQEIK